jgi:hypothetical protein
VPEPISRRRGRDDHQRRAAVDRAGLRRAGLRAAVDGRRLRARRRQPADAVGFRRRPVGRRTVFQVGLGVFTLGSLAPASAGWSRSAPSRLDGSMLNPVAMAIVTNTDLGWGAAAITGCFALAVAATAVLLAWSSRTAHHQQRGRRHAAPPGGYRLGDRLDQSAGRLIPRRRRHRVRARRGAARAPWPRASRPAWWIVAAMGARRPGGVTAGRPGVDDDCAARGMKSEHLTDSEETARSRRPTPPT